jgi:hypothetical protein
MPAAVLLAMLRRVMASRIENCCTPSLPGGTSRSPTPSPGPPNARGAQDPKAAAPAAPAAAPRNFRRLMLWSLLMSPPRSVTAGCRGR